jgi:hypothetical protein
MDIKDMGAVVPLVMGKPDKWYRVPTTHVGVRGFTTSGFAAGATKVEFKRITDGRDKLVAGQKIFIHTRTPLYTIDSSEWNDELQLVTLTLASGLQVDVPRGGFVQQWGGIISGGTANHNYRWCIAGNRIGAWDNDEISGHIGWLRSNGEIVVADSERWETWGVLTSPASGPYKSGTPEAYLKSSLVGVSALLVMVDGTEEDPTPPCFFPPVDPSQVGIAAQPQFDATARLSSQLNYPTGGTGTNNDLARDGNPSTGASLGMGAIITLTFNHPPSPFVDGDTSASTLHVITQGTINFTDSLGSTSYGSTTGAGGTNWTFRFTQASARDYDAVVRCVGAGGSGGIVVEVWWEHDLDTEEASTRTQDVVLTNSGNVGEVLEYAELVFRVPSYKAGSAGWTYTNRTHGGSINTQLQTYDAALSGVSNPVAPYPDAVVATLASMLLGWADGSIHDVNRDVYALAHQRFVENDIRLNFVLQDPLSTWTELEAELAIQCRSQMYYGPSGHEIVYMENAVDVGASGVVQEFRLPSVPGVNAMRGAGQLLERLPASQVVNTAEAEFNLDTITKTYESNIKVIDADSEDIFGERRDPRSSTRYSFWAHSPYLGHPTYSALTSVSGIIQHYASRAAFGATRFAFDTAWIAHGVERGSPVRVVYEVAAGSYRHVVCEVEDIGVSPINGDKFSVRCRAVELPSRGLPAYVWLDVFTKEDSDRWLDELLDTDDWTSRWNVT